jgi:hypothetical protein
VFECVQDANPSVLLLHWIAFVSNEWDRFITAIFNVPEGPNDGFFQKGFKVIMFRYREKACYERFLKLMMITDLIVMDTFYYRFDHRLLAFAVIWRVLNKEFVENDERFYRDCGMPSVLTLFSKSAEKNQALEWFLDLLTQFSSIYIGEAVKSLSEHFEYVDGFLQQVYQLESSCLFDPVTSDNTYEGVLALQGYSLSYLHISNSLSNRII